MTTKKIELESAKRAIYEETEKILRLNPTEIVGKEVWRIKKLIGKECTEEDLDRVCDEALETSFHDVSEKIDHKLILISSIAKWGHDVRTEQEINEDSF